MPHWTRLWLSHPTTLCCGQTAPLLAPMHHRAPPCTTRTSPGSVVDKGHSGMSATARLTSRRTETLHSHRTCCEQSRCDVFSAGLLKWRSTVSTESTAHPKERCYCYLARTLPQSRKNAGLLEGEFAGNVHVHPGMCGTVEIRLLFACNMRVLCFCVTKPKVQSSEGTCNTRWKH